MHPLTLELALERALFRQGVEVGLRQHVTHLATNPDRQVRGKVLFELCHVRQLRHLLADAFFGTVGIRHPELCLQFAAREFCVTASGVPARHVVLGVLAQGLDALEFSGGRLVALLLVHQIGQLGRHPDRVPAPDTHQREVRPLDLGEHALDFGRVLARRFGAVGRVQQDLLALLEVLAVVLPHLEVDVLGSRGQGFVLVVQRALLVVGGGLVLGVVACARGATHYGREAALLVGAQLRPLHVDKGGVVYAVLGELLHRHHHAVVARHRFGLHHVGQLLQREPPQPVLFHEADRVDEEVRCAVPDRVEEALRGRGVDLGEHHPPALADRATPHRADTVDVGVVEDDEVAGRVVVLEGVYCV